jgi:KipI family sensor histidine kinase inhibitor
MHRQARFLPAGDKALCVELGDAISPEINHQVRSLLLAVDKELIPGITDMVPTYRSILVYYDPMSIDYSELEAQLCALNDHLENMNVGTSKVVEVPTVYGGEYGPDLEYVAGYNGLNTDEVVRIHSGTDYLVYMMGFTPGFTYLGGMSERIATPRLQTPRVAIPAGSVGIAEQQTGVYPMESPGGWRLIGRTPIKIFDADRNPPVAVEAGNYARFVPVSEAEYLDLGRQREVGN